MNGIGYPDFTYTAEHINFAKFNEGKLIKHVYFWTTVQTDEGIEYYLKLLADKFLPGDGQKLISKTWGRRKGHPKVIVVRLVFEVNG